MDHLPTAPAPGTLEHWFSSKPTWLRVAVSLHLADAWRLTDAQVEQLADRCLDETAGRPVVPAPPFPPGALTTAPAAAPLRLDHIGNIRGVNALAPHAALDFQTHALNVVYGGNGSGKSGYARLVKRLCGSRGAQPIHGNVFEDQRSAPSATITMSTGSASAKSATMVEWKDDDGPISALKVVQVFDTPTATQLGTTPNTATYLPRSMQVMGALIDTVDRVQDTLRGRQEAMVPTLPVLPPQFAGTAAEGFYRSLRGTLTEADVLAACGLTKEDNDKRIALEHAFAQTDPATAYAQASRAAEHAATLVSTVAHLAVQLSDEACGQLILAHKDAHAKRAAANTFAQGLIKDAPLPGVGGDVWRRLWQHAQAYAAVAYPDHPHPNVEEEARCVLCQQPLEPEARQRLTGFNNYVQHALADEAALAEQHYTALADHMPRLPGAIAWQPSAEALGVAAAELDPLIRQVSSRLAALSDAEDLMAVPGVDWAALAAHVVAAEQRAVYQREALRSLVDPEGRAAQQRALNELQGRHWLGTVRPSISAEIARQQAVAELSAACQAAGTKALAQKNNDIGEKELAGGYQERFNRELRILGGSHLPVELNHRREGKGKLVFFISLVGARHAVRQPDVLSEGEQRIVALAAFLADVEGSVSLAPAVFDDPISSLDQQFEEAVAQRLVGLAAARQVIVFTHRLSMMSLLKAASEKRVERAEPPVSVGVVAIERDGRLTGVPSTIDPFSLSPKEGLAQVAKEVQAAATLDLGIRKAVLKSACGNFRILLERTVEHHLCSKLYTRFKREIHTKGIILRLTAIEPSDCSLVDRFMTKYSVFEHSQPDSSPAWLPTIEELLVDIAEVQDWIVDFDKRAKKMLTYNPAEGLA